MNVSPENQSEQKEQQPNNHTENIGVAAVAFESNRAQHDAEQLKSQLNTFAAQFDRSDGLSKQEKREQFEGVMHEFEAIGKAELEKGRGKLRATIPEIVASENGDGRFQDGKVEYLPARGEAIFVGDTHGDLISTKQIIEQSDFLGKMARGEDAQLVFLGDYADRGKNDVGNVAYILKLKTMFPNNVTLMRGNHEDGGVIKDKRTRTKWHSIIASFAEVLVDDEIASENLADEYIKLAEDYMPRMLVAGNGVVASHGNLPVESFSLTDVDGNARLQHALMFNEPNTKGSESDYDFSRSIYVNLPRYMERGLSEDEAIKQIIADKRERIANGENTIMLISENDFNERLQGIGGTVLIRGHQDRQKELLFDDKLMTVFSTSVNSAEQGQGVENARYATVDLSQPIAQFDQNNIHHF